MAATVHTIPYGEHVDQVVDLWSPHGPASGRAGVVLLHGGFWYQRYARDLMDPLAADLAARGYTVANVEYRRVGGDGGWPQTFEDVASAVDHLPRLDGFVPTGSEPIVIGHSAGGHLALWAAARARLPGGAVGSDPRVRPGAVITLAGVCDLRAAARDRLGVDAVRKLLGGVPDEVPERVRVAAPDAYLPFQVPLVLIHGHDDELVPVSQTTAFAEQARASGDSVDEILVDGDHFAALDPTSDAWSVAVDHLDRLTIPRVP